MADHSTSHCLPLQQIDVGANMGHMSYNRVSSGNKASSKCRGFRLNPKRFYVLRLRKRFNFFFRLFHSWKLISYGEALQLLKKVVCRKSVFKRNNSTSSSKRSFVREEKMKDQEDCRMRSYGRSNSFYAEAIADCLEFIKRTSISSMDQIEDPINHIQDTNS
ncbi:hypothetical protein VNO77_02365 [Canavalia gladiata]|uniref:Uncharacterized protein n=1 Tax=Canavalia gladiata TaxID=3824 RepID=A0AAN9MTM3_CANGL